MSELNKVIENSKEKRKDYTFGKVLSCNSDTGKAVVYLPEYKMQKVMMNKSGEILEPGDSVWIHCHGGGIASGYIAIRNGVPKPMGGGGGFAINNAVVMTEGQADTYAPNGEIINVDVNNRLTTKYSNFENKFIIQGNVACLGTVDYFCSDEIQAEAYKYCAGSKITLPTNVVLDQTIAGCDEYTTLTVEPYTIGYNKDSAHPGTYIQYNSFAMNNKIKKARLRGSDTVVYQNYKLNSTTTVNVFDSFPNCVFLILASNIYASTAKYPFGYISCDVFLIPLNGQGQLLLYGTNNSLTSLTNVNNATKIGTLNYPTDSYDNKWATQYVDVDASGFNRITKIPFKSKAEYDFAVGITQKTELPPSLR